MPYSGRKAYRTRWPPLLPFPEVESRRRIFLAPPPPGTTGARVGSRDRVLEVPKLLVAQIQIRPVLGERSDVDKMKEFAGPPTPE